MPSREAWRWGVWLASLALACGGPPEPPATDASDGTAERQVASVPSEGAPPAEPASGVYDPRRDPLVNPPALLEKAPEDRPEEIAYGETLIRHLEGNPTNLNPIFFSARVEGDVQELLYEGLFTFDAQMEWAINPVMVESFEPSADHRVDTVRIRPGLTWHDGQPFTAHDVRASYQLIMDDRVPAPAVRSGTDQLDDVRVVDDLTVQFVHKEALPTNVWNIMFPVVPRHIYDNPAERAKDPSLLSSEYYNRYNREKVVGNGRFRFVEWIPNDRIVVERWEGFSGPRPHFRRVIFKINPDANTSLLLFKKAEVDELQLSAQQFATQTADAEFAAVGLKAFAPEWTYSYIGWNMDGSNPFFTDARVRRAMAHALNVPRMIETLGYNLYEQSHGIFHPAARWADPSIKPIQYDLKEAARLLDEAGWRQSPDDGWRYQTLRGRPRKFEFTLMIPQGAATSEKLAAIFGQDLKRIGVSLLTRTIEWATFQDFNRRHEFEAMIAAWGTGTDPDTLWNIFHSSTYDDGRNYVGYRNPRVDELFELQRREFDESRRIAYFQEIQRLIYEDQPYAFLFTRATTWAFHKRLRGVQFSPRGIAGFDPGVIGWWVHRHQQLRS